MNGWEPDLVAKIENPSAEDRYKDITADIWDGWHKALLWIVPAKVEGGWKFQEGNLLLRQEFQMLYGNYVTESKTTEITDGRINGYTVTFSIDGKEYTGRLAAEGTLEGTVTAGAGHTEWMAVPLNAASGQ